jgi:hypothetical protein
MSSNSKSMSMPVEKFDINKASLSLTKEMVEKQDKQKKTKQPYWGMISYKYTHNVNGSPVQINSTPVILTGDIKLVMGGIPKNPKEGDPIYATEADRSKIVIPLDESQEACVALEKCLRQIDDFAGSDKNFANVLSGLKDKKYVYSTMVREPSEKAKEGFRFRTVKASLDVDFETKAIKTKVFVKKADGTKEQVEINSLSDVEKYVRFGSTVKCGFAISKLWATKSKMGGQNYAYGVGMKCLQIVVAEQGTSGARSEFSQYMFDDDEGQVVEASPKKQEKPQAVVEAPKQLKKIEISEEEDESDSDEEPVVKAPPPPVKKIEISVDEDDSDEESSDDEPVSKKKVMPKKPTKKEESSEEAPKKSKAKKVVKKKSVSSDEEDED